MTASLYRKYNTFSDRESEQQHRTMIFAELPNHPLLLTMVIAIDDMLARMHGDLIYDNNIVHLFNNYIYMYLLLGLPVVAPSLGLVSVSIFH